MRSTFDPQKWPEQLRLQRGLLNGERVQMARQGRGIERYVLARKVGIPAKTLAEREIGWHFWDEDEQVALSRITDFPIAFFAQNDPPTFESPMFLCCSNEDDERYCIVTQGEKAE